MFLLAILAASAGQDLEPSLEFSRTPVFDSRVDTVEAGVFADPRAVQDHAPYYWFRRVVRYRPDLKLGKKASVQWTDTRSCPEARWVLTEAMKLELPKLYLPDAGGEQILVRADGVKFELSAKARFPDWSGDRIKVIAFGSSPLADYVDESLRKLAPCWSKDRSADPFASAPQ
jgi:hypothetical protein